MDYRDPPDIAEFRQDIRSWLRTYSASHNLSFGAADFENMHRWWRDLAGAGYVAMSFPEEYGGQGRADIYDAVVNQELGLALAPPAPPIAHIAHSIADFGNDDVKRRFLPGLLSCVEPWCQGFSEPDAGSDLASLTTRGVVAGDVLRIDGQKIWTSGAMWSKWCLLFLRTEPDLPRHRGLSMVVVDMASPGVDRREITLSTGSREFAEVFFDDVEVPLTNLVGERGQGWAIAMHMLSYERGPADMGWTGRYAKSLAQAHDAFLAGSQPSDEALRLRLAQAGVGVRVLDWHVQRTLANRGDNSDANGSIDKLLATRVEQELYRVIADVHGGEAVTTDDASFHSYLYSRAQSIYGGSQQIQRSLVAQRLLGLPRA